MIDTLDVISDRVLFRAQHPELLYSPIIKGLGQ
jgi:hypothetical protein